MAKIKETKTQAQERLFNNYKRSFNAIPDFDSFLESCTTPADKKVFTPQTFKNYFYKHFEMSKEMTKAFKDGKIKKGDIIVESLTCIGNEIKGQKFGGRKRDETIMSFCKDWNLKKGKLLTDKKIGIGVIQDFEINRGTWGKCHFFISNEYGNHVRHADGYFHQFIETAKLRKTYTLTN